MLSLVLAAGFAAIAGGCGTTDLNIEYISLAELQQLRSDQERDPRQLLLLDPRPPRNFAEVHIPGAQNMQIDSFNESAGTDPKFDGFRNLVVYGEHPSSPSAKGLTKKLMRTGYDGVRMYDGGLEEWLAARLPVAAKREEDLPELRRPAPRSSRP